MIKKQTRNKLRKKRQLRFKKKIRGDAETPRLSVFKSLKQIYVQVIDDASGKTIVGMGTNQKLFIEKSEKPGANIENSKILGDLVAKSCLEKNIDKVVFDRSGYKYHGMIKNLAESAREAGLRF